MRYAVTGPARIDRAQENLVAQVVERHLRLPASRDERTEFTSGCAHGVDTVGVDAAMRAGVRRIRLVIPLGEWHNERLAGVASSRRWIVERIEGGYMARNDAVVERADVVFAFPRTAAEEARSGTWATIRRARKAKRELRVFPLDGSQPWTEPAG